VHGDLWSSMALDAAVTSRSRGRSRADAGRPVVGLSGGQSRGHAGRCRGQPWLVARHRHALAAAGAARRQPRARDDRPRGRLRHDEAWRRRTWRKSALTTDRALFHSHPRRARIAAARA
jgi:hypothetical protein